MYNLLAIDNRIAILENVSGGCATPKQHEGSLRR